VSLEETIAQAVREAVRAEVEPVRLELERLRSSSAPPLVSIKEAARTLGVSKRTVERWVRTSRVEVVRVGSVVRVRLPPGVRAA
jgi:excisionase family DNA binding protein